MTRIWQIFADFFVARFGAELTNLEDLSILSRREQITYLQAASLLGALLLLTNTPRHWDRWQAGAAFPIVVLVLVLVVVVGALAFLLGRRRWFSVWVWRGWAMGVLAIPVFTAVLDTTPVYILQPLALLLLVICGVHFLVKGGGHNLAKVAALCLIPLIVAAMFMGYDPWADISERIGRIGPCHLFSELRGNGCVRSFPLSDGVPIVIQPDPETGKERLIRAYGSAVWIEPLNRWEALVNSKAIQTGGQIDTVQPADPAIWAEGQLVSLTKNDNSSRLYLVNTETGESAGTIMLTGFYVRYPDFSSDGKYLAITAYKRESDTFWGLIFDVEKLLPPEVETPD